MIELTALFVCGIALASYSFGWWWRGRWERERATKDRAT